MMKEELEYQLPQRPMAVFHYQWGHRLLGHGNLCPWCKSAIMNHEFMELVYRIPLTFRVKGRVYYHKLNWDYVCGPECALAMTKKWQEGKLAQKALEAKILITPNLPAVPKKLNDTYRDQVLKMCRLDPKMNPNIVVTSWRVWFDPREVSKILANLPQ